MSVNVELSFPAYLSFLSERKYLSIFPGRGNLIISDDEIQVNRIGVVKAAASFCEQFLEKIYRYTATAKGFNAVLIIPCKLFLGTSFPQYVEIAQKTSEFAEAYYKDLNTDLSVLCNFRGLGSAKSEYRIFNSNRVPLSKCCFEINSDSFIF